MVGDAEDSFHIFSDVSFDRTLEVGVAGYLSVRLKTRDDMANPATSEIHTKVFRGPSCSRMELESILWAINEHRSSDRTALPVVVHTDSRTASELLSRRAKLEKNEFKSKRTGLMLANAAVYREFFALWDQLPFVVLWNQGHTSSQGQAKGQDGESAWVQKLFARVDHRTRKELRCLRAP